MTSTRSGILKAWSAALRTTDSGELMLANVLFAFKRRRPDQDTIRRVLIEVASRWKPDGGRRPDTIIEIIADDLFQHDGCCPPQAVRIEPCSRVVEAVTFVINNIDHRELGYGISDEVPAGLLNQIQGKIPQELARNEIRGRRPLAWITKTAHLRELRDQSRPDELATVVRDRLGLAHYNEDKLLLEIEYPTDTVAALSYSAPTFLEGGAGIVFRARECEDLWGRAVDLSTLDDGLPEAVHRPIPFTGGFQVRVLGRVRRAPGFEFDEMVARAKCDVQDTLDDFLEFLDTLDESDT